VNPLLLDVCRHHRVTLTEDGRDGVLIGQKDDAPLQRRLNAIIPVSFACIDGVRVASGYPAVSHALNAHMTEYRDTLFSDRSLTSLHRALIPYLTEWGYRPSPFYLRYGIACLFGPTTPVPTEQSPAPAQLCRLGEQHLRLRNLTSMKISDCVARGAFGCVEDGAICAVAAVNSSSDAEHCVEIGVECAPDYRRRGFALASVRALTDMLTAEGKTVLYRYYVTNTASAAVAARAGFVPAGGFFAYTAFRV